MQRLKLYLQLSALFTIISTHVPIQTASSESQKIDQLCLMAKRKARIHEPSSVIASQDQNLFPKKKHELLSERIGIIDEKVQRLSSDQNKDEALENLNQRIVNLKNYYGIESDLDQRLFMAPLERAKHDQQTLSDLRNRLIMVKKKLALEQKYFEITKKNLTNDAKKEKSLMLAHLGMQLAKAKQQLNERKKILFDLNKKISQNSKLKHKIKHQQQIAYNATQKKKYSDAQKKLTEQKLQLKTEEKNLLTLNKNLKIAEKQKAQLEKKESQKQKLFIATAHKQKSLKINERNNQLAIRKNLRIEQRNLKHAQQQTKRESRKTKKLAMLRSKPTSNKKALSQQQENLPFWSALKNKYSPKNVTQKKRISLKTVSKLKKINERNNRSSIRKSLRREQRNLKLAQRQAKRKSKKAKRLARILS